MSEPDAQTALTWEQAVASLRDQPGQDEFVRACFYDDPLAAAAARYHASSEWAALRRELPTPPGAALDIGAGRGIGSYALARDGWTVTALEPDPSNYVGAGAIRALAAQEALPIDVVEQWGETLPFPDDSFDVVYCRAVLHHARDLGVLCAEIARVLKPGGRLAGIREHVITDHAQLDDFLAIHPLHSLYGGEHAYTRAEYRGAIEAGGMRILREYNPYASDINLYPRTMVELKGRLAAKLRLPFLSPWVPGAALTLAGRLDRTPGRLHSFICEKPARGR